MPHQAKAAVIRCIDFRFVGGVNQELVKLGYDGVYDLVSVAGAAKNLVDPAVPTDAEFVFRQLEIARRLHEIQEVLLINHLDCGAYGKIFANPGEERTRHTQDLAAAAARIREKLPGLKIRCFLAALDESGRVSVAELA